MSAFASVELLEKHLSTRSYITGYSLSEDDKKELKALSGVPCPSKFPNVYRWAIHIVALTGINVNQSAKSADAPAPAAKNDDLDDMFGNDVYEEAEGTAEEIAATKARQERMALAKKLKDEKDAKEGKKKKKEAVVEKSLVVLDVKPWEADTDLEMVWHKIREYKQEGLTWGETFKLEPVAYGIKKLVMTATIVDSLVVLDDVTENIEALEEWVQSVNIASMNKI